MKTNTMRFILWLKYRWVFKEEVHLVQKSDLAQLIMGRQITLHKIFLFLAWKSGPIRTVCTFVFKVDYRNVGKWEIDLCLNSWVYSIWEWNLQKSHCAHSVHTIHFIFVELKCAVAVELYLYFKCFSYSVRRKHSHACE